MDKEKEEKEIEFSVFLKDVLAVDKESLKPLDGSEKSKEFAILFGNGLLTSHPKLGEQFNFCYKCIIKNELFKEFSKFPNSENITSLENSVTVLKYLLLDILLKKYIGIMNGEASKLKNVNLKSFMKCFNPIFTLSYDPVIYLNIFDKDASTSFSDGFQGSKKLLIEEIKPQSNNQFFYLHGALHIIADVKNNRFYKLTKTNENSMLKEIENKIQEIFTYWKEKRELEENLTLVFAVKPHYKEAEIIRNPYLNMCFDRFKKVKKLFIFGCSFEFDTHIISALVKSKEIENIFISFLKDLNPMLNSKRNFKKKLRKLVDRGELSSKDFEEFNNKIIWVDTSDFAAVVWGEEKE